MALTGCLAHRPAPPPAPSGAEQPPPPPPLLGRQPHAEPELVVRHTVEKGQNLYRIALAYGLTVAELARANGIRDPSQLRVGQELVIPKALVPREVQPAPTGEPSAHPAAAQARPPRPGEGSGELSWPLKGVLYARFGKKGDEPHDGIDLAAPLGTPVHAAAKGKVVYAAPQKGYGLLAIVDHGGGLITLYAHNQSLRVKAGQTVRRGQVIATVGESGRTSGPHLHFEVRKAGIPEDPLRHLGPLG